MIGRSKPISDPVLGDLTWSRRMWRGNVTIGGGAVLGLAIIGDRGGPDAAAVGLAQSIASRFEVWRPAIEAALGEHAAVVGVEPDEFPTPLYAAVITVDGHLGIEFGYSVEWDEEHTLGARIQDDELLELNGSVLSP